MSDGKMPRTEMRIIRTVAEMTAARDGMTGSVGLVPTMGYLHEGHLSLVRRARADNDHVIVTIFVNPTQFGPGEDLDRYPRDEERDLALLDDERADVVFAPTAAEIYPPGFDDWVEVTGPLTERLEGARRPEQRIPVDIIPMPIIREPDGLAMSSRNVYLSAEERALALRLSQSLRLAQRLVVHDGVTDAETVRGSVRDCVETPRKRVSGREERSALTLDYVSVSDEQTLEELDIIDRPALVLLAARIGATRLIDNTLVVPKGMPAPPDLQPLMASP
jgi:pantoate--beta-alanine ligase